MDELDECCKHSHDCCWTNKRTNEILKFISFSSSGKRLPLSRILKCASPPLMLSYILYIVHERMQIAISLATKWNEIFIEHHRHLLLLQLVLRRGTPIWIADIEHNSEIKSRSLRRNYLICIYSPQNGWTQLISFIISLDFTEQRGKNYETTSAKAPRKWVLMFCWRLFRFEYA